MRYALGEYVISADSDDWVDKEAYEQMYHKAKQEDADVVMCDIAYEYEHSTEVHRVEDFNNVENILKASLNGTIHNSLCNKMIRRDVFCSHNIKWNDGADMLEDTFVVPQVFFFSSKVSYLHKAFYHYLQFNTESITSSKKRWNCKNFDAIITNTNKLTEFFLNQNKYNLKREIMYTMSSSKNMLLFFEYDKHKRRQYHKMYRNCSLVSILAHPTLSVRRKLVLVLSKLGQYGLADMVIRLK